MIDTTGKTATGILGTVLDDINALLKNGVSDPDLSRLLSTLASDITSLAGLGSTDINQLSPAVTTLLSNVAGDVTTLVNQFGSTLQQLSPTLGSVLNTVITDVNCIVHGLVSPQGLGGTVTDALSTVNTTISGVLGLLNNVLTPSSLNLLSTLNNAISAVSQSGSGQGGLGNLLGSLLGSGSGNNNAVQTLVGQVSSDVSSLLNGSGGISLDVLVGDLASLQVNLNTALTGSLSQTVQGLLNTVQGAVTSVLSQPTYLLTAVNGDLQSALHTLTTTLPSLPQGASGLLNNVTGLLGSIGSSLSSTLSSGGTLAASTLRDLSLLESNIAGLLGNVGTQLGTTVTDTLNTLLTDIINLLGTQVNSGGSGGSGGGGGSGGTNASLALASNINGNIGSLVVNYDLSNVFVNVAGGIKSLKIGGSLIGGSSVNSGEIFTTGDIHNLHIGKNVLGGLNLNSGSIVTNGRIFNFSAGGSIIGGSGNSSGDLVMKGDSSHVSVRGDLVGNSGLFSASIDDANGRIGTVNIRGSVMAGSNTDSGSIRVAGDIHSLRVHGNVIGDAGHSVEITAAATKSPTDKADSAFGKIAIGGRIAYSNILGGYDTDLHAVNGHAQIGNVTVKGDWIASNLVAGIKTSTGDTKNFGSATDSVIAGAGPAGVISRIASIRIGGTVIGTTGNTTDHFGFEAQDIGKFRYGTTIVQPAVITGNSSTVLSQQTGGDVTLSEIGTTHI